MEENETEEKTKGKPPPKQIIKIVKKKYKTQPGCEKPQNSGCISLSPEQTQLYQNFLKTMKNDSHDTGDRTKPSLNREVLNDNSDLTLSLGAVKKENGNDGEITEQGLEEYPVKIERPEEDSQYDNLNSDIYNNSEHLDNIEVKIETKEEIIDDEQDDVTNDQNGDPDTSQSTTENVDENNHPVQVISTMPILTQGIQLLQPGMNLYAAAPGPPGYAVSLIPVNSPLLGQQFINASAPQLSSQITIIPNTTLSNSGTITTIPATSLASTPMTIIPATTNTKSGITVLPNIANGGIRLIPTSGASGGMKPIVSRNTITVIPANTNKNKDQPAASSSSVIKNVWTSDSDSGKNSNSKKSCTKVSRASKVPTNPDNPDQPSTSNSKMDKLPIDIRPISPITVHPKLPVINREEVSSPAETQNKKFKCDSCSHSTDKKDNLRRHILTSHSSHKPFKCPHCEYRSAVPEGLKRHIVTHSTKKPFQCTNCSYSASQKRSVVVHFMNNHCQNLNLF